MVLSKNASNPVLRKEFKEKADQRKVLIQEYFWNDSLGIFTDYIFNKGKSTNVISAAGLFPLYFGTATEEQAKKTVATFTKHLLKPGGVVTSVNNTGQQWDAPNGWAPLQWMCVKGLDRYGYKDMAKEVASRWVKLNEKVYKSQTKFVEKYNVEDLSLEAGGGEYPVQDGFGWSNGVYVALKAYLEKSKSARNNE
ncbi:MAG: trehalase family glycosidase [Bacteroidota bacterium]